MKYVKGIVSVAVVMVMVTLLSACTNANTAKTPVPTPGTSAIGNGVDAIVTDLLDEISAEEAKTIALAHAGVAAEDATGLRAELDYDFGARHYDVEFFVGTTEYDIEVNAQTGTVNAYDIDGQPVADTSTAVTAEQAQSIALAHAGFAAEEVTNLRSEYEIDDGMAQYEVSFRVGRLEYDYTISADSGEVLAYEADD